MEVVPVAGICCIADLARRIGPLGGAGMGKAVDSRGLWGRAGAILALAALCAACASAPGFAPVVPGAQPQPGSQAYRDLATIPERPAPPPSEDVEIGRAHV